MNGYLLPNFIDSAHVARHLLPLSEFAGLRPIGRVDVHRYNGTAIRYDVAELVDPLVHVVARIEKRALAHVGKSVVGRERQFHSAGE
jgi:hypothetical protein